MSAAETRPNPTASRSDARNTSRYRGGPRSPPQRGDFAVAQLCQGPLRIGGRGEAKERLVGGRWGGRVHGPDARHAQARRILDDSSQAAQ
eukprot:13664747-Alexandrium_andersonii.AAC.1